MCFGISFVFCTACSEDGLKLLQWKGADEVSLADMDTVLAEDGVRRRHVEIEVGQELLRHVFESGKVLAVPIGKRHLYSFFAYYLLRLNAFDEVNGFL